MDIKNPTTHCICCYSTLWNIMSAKQAIIEKLQGSVATRLRCGVVVNNQIRKGLLLSLSVNFFKSVNIWQSYKQERDCLMHFFVFWQCVGQVRKVHETTTLLLERATVFSGSLVSAVSPCLSFPLFPFTFIPLISPSYFNSNSNCGICIAPLLKTEGASQNNRCP